MGRFTRLSGILVEYLWVTEMFTYTTVCCLPEFLCHSGSGW